jgi:hypothetical protein
MWGFACGTGDPRFDIQLARRWHGWEHMKRFSIAVILAIASIVAAGCESSSNPVSPAGLRSCAWSMNGVHALLVRKDGIALARADGNYGSGTEYILARVTGDTQVDIEVVRR